MTARVLAADIRPGDTILPPARELRLWMRREVETDGMPESWLHITVSDVSIVDKGWLLIEGTQHNERGTHWHIRARPTTKWPVVACES